ncbi:uncharacterized protein AMSG_08524 [Thecamonas trahens ATCC 50062]|uniref:Uncharacterized protein n=1 Tax=Thecamonas trahens ATCC 50062 TaxID=461836 RepID=A0A0L0DKC7_THETB|nr:hypothetical protein AMSG_08524 [Thecamonas trahens ATCC 50062]KNC52655.1 hypothetical protein AMSG_08524 [Thecamonas trahens ATCC 50062]|eukprot:XP_013755206.1 hypothetical protein AMSG_08524 [Thecamonas trahens ATCC 50062]
MQHTQATATLAAAPSPASAPLAQGGLMQAIRFSASAKAALAADGLLHSQGQFDLILPALDRLALLAEDAVHLCLAAVHAASADESAQGALLFALHIADEVKAARAAAGGSAGQDLGSGMGRHAAQAAYLGAMAPQISPITSKWAPQREVYAPPHAPHAAKPPRGRTESDVMIDKLAAALLRSAAEEKEKGADVSADMWDALKAASELSSVRAGKISLPLIDSSSDSCSGSGSVPDSPHRRTRKRGSRRKHRRRKHRSSRRRKAKRKSRCSQGSDDYSSSESSPRRAHTGLTRVRVIVGDRTFLIAAPELPSWSVRDLCDAATLRANRNAAHAPVVVRELVFRGAICGEDDWLADLVGVDLGAAGTPTFTMYDPADGRSPPPHAYSHPAIAPRSPYASSPPISPVRQPPPPRRMEHATPPPTPMIPGVNLDELQGLDEATIKERLAAALSGVPTDTLVNLAASLQ